ncbi:MAG: CHAD domain-containing protein, partial [Pseudomonadota bacterium]
EALRGPAAEALATQARDLSAVAGDLRDLDVQIDEVLRPRAAQGGADAAGFATLAAALEARRGDARARLRAALTGAQGRALLFDLSAFVALRGWLRPADHGQTAGLARPAQKTAVKALDRLWKKARRAAPEALAPDAADTPRHALREDLKKLRYAVEFLSPAFAPKAAKPFRRRLKRLQDAFGALNDGAVAERLFAGEAPPAAEDPAAQRAAGRLLGALAVQAEADREAARDGWQALVDEPRFWR